MILYSDSDIKIAGNKPSRDINKRLRNNDGEHIPEKDKIDNAKELGRRVALESKTAFALIHGNGRL